MTVFYLKTQKVRGKYPHGVSKIRHAKYCWNKYFLRTHSKTIQVQRKAFCISDLENRRETGMRVIIGETRLKLHPCCTYLLK